jgi:hypothetical protein
LYRRWIEVNKVRITMAHCGSLAARQQPAGRIHKQTVAVSCRNGRRFPAAALPRAAGQIRDP